MVCCPFTAAIKFCQQSTIIIDFINLAAKKNKHVDEDE